jgi:hypothetical protein
MAGKPSLLEQVRQCLRLKHYSIRTERAYVDWIKRFILFHRKRHPSEMGSDEIRHFLSNLATEGKVAASTQNQALCASSSSTATSSASSCLTSRASSGPGGRPASPSCSRAPKPTSSCPG